MLSCIPFSLFSQGSSHFESTATQYKGDSCIIDSDDPVWTQDETNVYFHSPSLFHSLSLDEKCDYHFAFSLHKDTRFIEFTMYGEHSSSPNTAASKTINFGCDKFDDILFLGSTITKICAAHALPCDVDENAAYLTEYDSDVIVTLPKK